MTHVSGHFDSFIMSQASSVLPDMVQTSKIHESSSEESIE